MLFHVERGVLDSCSTELTVKSGFDNYGNHARLDMREFMVCSQCWISCTNRRFHTHHDFIMIGKGFGFTNNRRRAMKSRRVEIPAVVREFMVCPQCWISCTIVIRTVK